MIWRTEKYGRSYGIDVNGFGEVPPMRPVVVELGEPAAVTSLYALPIQWMTVCLWCARREAQRRLSIRGDSDYDDRIAAWDNTQPIQANLILNTAAISTLQAAKMIAAVWS